MEKREGKWAYQRSQCRFGVLALAGDTIEPALQNYRSTHGTLERDAAIISRLKQIERKLSR
jgi:hypothetical protein